MLNRTKNHLIGWDRAVAALTDLCCCKHSVITVLASWCLLQLPSGDRAVLASGRPTPTRDIITIHFVNNVVTKIRSRNHFKWYVLLHNSIMFSHPQGCYLICWEMLCANLIMVKCRKENKNDGEAWCLGSCHPMSKSHFLWGPLAHYLQSSYSQISTDCISNCTSWSIDYTVIWLT